VGYFDALTSGTFKTAPDGKRLFFPWGTLGRGYVIESEADYDRLRQQVKSYLIVGMILVIGSTAGRAYLPGLAAAAVWCALYVAWMAFALRRLQPSTETLTAREVISVQARTHSPIFLWAGLVGSLGFVAIGVFMVAVDPSQRLIGGGVALFFAFCAIRFVQMILARRQR
jgi:hypothetical protein